MIGKKARAKKVRLDQLLIDRGLATTPHQAEALILSGKINCGLRIVVGDSTLRDCGIKSTILRPEARSRQRRRNHQSKMNLRPGTMVSPELEISIIEPVNPYVSRGGLKLAGALAAFKIDLKDKIAIDIGASTGGFTDCMLQNGAKKVYAIDTGYGHFASKLRNDPRVVLLEKVNARYLTKAVLSEKSEILKKASSSSDLGLKTSDCIIDLAVIDVSFISLTKIIPAVIPLLKSAQKRDLAKGGEDGEIVALIKPQFEVPKSVAKKNKGVVLDPELREQAVQSIAAFAVQCGLKVIGIVPAVITGPAGNQEYFIYLKIPINRDKSKVQNPNVK